jgi:pSer/pThr/pTyr-binding forkhead associated (FHA) protein
MPRLVSQSPEFAGRSFELSGREITVGRLEDNAIQLEHASVSGHHAVLTLDEQDYILKDLDSTNGSRVNGEKITSQKLRRNDMVRLGNIELLYDSEHAPPGRPMPSLSERVNLAECATKGHPGDFANASPLKKRDRYKEKTRWPLVIAILTVLAVAGVAYFVWGVFINPPTLG